MNQHWKVSTTYYKMKKKKSTVCIFGYRYLEKHTIQLTVVNVKEVYKGTLTCTFYSLYFYSREFFLRQNIQHLKWTKSKISIFKNQRISRSVSLFFLKAIFLLSLTCKCTYLHLFGCPVSPKSSLDFLLCFPKPVQSWAAQGQINKSAAEVIASGKKRTLSLRKQPKPSAGRKKHLGGRRKTTKSIDEDTERTERQLGYKHQRRRYSGCFSKVAGDFCFLVQSALSSAREDCAPSINNLSPGAVSNSSGRPKMRALISYFHFL